jgi:hypothetical protein
VFACYAFFGSAGRPFKQWPAYMADYDMLSDSFRDGHTYLPIAPDPQLIAAENPYDPVNVHLWVLDDSYYKGKYYLYWGPVPSLIQAIVKSALGITWTIGDQYIVFFASCGAAVAGSILLQRISVRLFGGVPAVLLYACLNAFVFANPILHLLTTGAVYQAAISAGQCFLWIGIALTCEALFRQQGGRSHWLRWLLAGVAFALALGSRLSLSLAIFAIVGITALFVALFPIIGAGRRARWRAAAVAACCMGAPLAFCLGGLMLYNKARFDDYFESGIRLQLSGFPYRFSFTYFPANVYSYFWQRARLTTEFPYVGQLVNLQAAALPEWLQFPPGYYPVEPLVGVLRVVPIVWLAPIPLLALIPMLRRWQPRHPSARVVQLAHACVTCGLAGSISAIPVFGLYFPSMRYLGDFTGGLVFLGSIGAFTLYSSVNSSVFGRRVIVAVVCSLSVVTVGCGVLLGYQGYNQHFERMNPKLHESIKKALSL